MCLNQKHIKSPYVRYMINTSCGNCPACLQAKAISRTNRIRANFSSESDSVALFVTLTYHNDCIPFFYMSDYVFGHEESDKYKTDDVNGFEYNYFITVPIYRGSKTRYNRLGRSYKTKKVRVKGEVLLGKADLPYGFADDLKYLRGQNEPKVGVCFFKDLQDFQKRLRQNLKRNGLPTNNYSFFQCSEYGPTTSRPHFHLLCFVPRKLYKSFKNAIVKSWPYDDGYRTRANIEIAKDAASYVSSYVNCDSSISKLFKNVRELRPHHSYSQGFGLALYEYSLSSVCKKIERRNLRCIVSRMRKGVLVNDDILLPKYVIARFFPKFKGYSRLTSDAIFAILLRPSELFRFKSTCGFDDEECRKIVVRLTNKIKYAESQGIAHYDYARYYSLVWTVYASNVMGDFYNSIDSPLNNMYAYDNLIETFRSSALPPTFIPIIDSLPKNYVFIEDYNLFPRNVVKDRNLREAYFSYSKDRKIRNICLSQTINV